MSKRRTRKQKERAKHNYTTFLASEGNEAPTGLRPRHLLPALRREQNPFEAEFASHSSASLRTRYSAKGDKTGSKSEKRKTGVKGQFRDRKVENRFKLKKNKVAKDKAKPDNLALIKQNIFRSFVQAGIILGLELVLYLYLKFQVS